MKEKTLSNGPRIVLLSSLMLLSTLVFTPLAQAVANESVKKGAQLYDKWYKFSESKPEGNHPLYPAGSKKSGETTWRCKECHGWDYIGKDGRYKSGSHFTGITGISNAAQKSKQELFDILSSSNHGFESLLTDDDKKALVEFIKDGQIAIKMAIDARGKGIGNAQNGATQYSANCADCHGTDGNEIDFKPKKPDSQGVGWLANDNPQETLHKIRWGHPGSDMPSLLTDKKLTDQDAIDILTYAQSLP